MAIFRKLNLTEAGEVYAHVEGHATEVLGDFHDVCRILLTSQGPWRMTEVKGTIAEDAEKDSEMIWVLVAKTKV